MTQNLSQRHEIVVVVFQELVGHGVPQQVRMQLETADRRILVAQRTDATVGQRASLADENLARRDRWPCVEVRLQSTAGGEWQRGASLLVSLAAPERRRPLAFAEDQVVQFEGNEIANTAATIEQYSEDCSRPQVFPQLNFPQQSAHLGLIQSFRGEGLSPQFLHRLGRVCGDMPRLGEPAKEASYRYQGTIDGVDGLPPIPAQVISEIAHVPGGHPANHERLVVGVSEPAGEFSEITHHRFAGISGKIMVAQEAGNEGRFFLADRDVVENIIATILHTLVN